MLQGDEILQVHPLRVDKAHCERNLGVLAFFYNIEGNFVCPAFLQFWYNIIHCKSA